MPRLCYALFTAGFPLFTALSTQATILLLKYAQVMRMLRQGAEKLTEVFCKRNWVDEDRRDWCAYTVEKWLGLLLFFSVVTVWMLISGTCLETLFFLVPFYLLRRRMGGYHAKSQGICFFLSVSIVIFVSAFLGKGLLALPEKLLLLLNAIAIALTLIVSPAYPPQLNFTEAEKKANLVRKNILALGIFLAQIFAEIVLNPCLLSYSFCGICFVLITVFIQKNKIKGERKMKKIERAATKIINKVIDIETYGWPPVCMGSMYQPTRPQIKPEKGAKNTKR